MLPEIRERTARAVAEADLVIERLEDCEPESDERAALEADLRGHIDHWARSMEALGLEVKGAWLVDFDNGEGCYCWKWPEEELRFFHGYDEGFDGRISIQ